MAIGMGAGMLAGGAMSMLSDIAGQAMTGYYNAKEAKKQRQFAKKMYSTRYQMTMADMAKAGLNPILAYKQGAGTPPSGTAASVSGAGAVGAGARAIQGVATGGRAGQSMATAQDVRDTISAQAERADADAATAWEQQKATALENERRVLDVGLARDDFDFYKTTGGQKVRNMARVREALGGSDWLSRGASALGGLAASYTDPSTTAARELKDAAEKYRKLYEHYHEARGDRDVRRRTRRKMMRGGTWGGR